MWGARGEIYGLGPESTEALSDRELEVLGGIARRLSNKEIAAELGIAPGTVKRHSHSVYSKLGVSDRRRVVARAIELGLLPVNDPGAA